MSQIQNLYKSKGKQILEQPCKTIGFHANTVVYLKKHVAKR